MSCWCVDLCTRANAEAFIGRTRNVSISTASGDSAWLGYLNAVFGGAWLSGHKRLSRLHFFYEGTAAWFVVHGGAPNPFRECTKAARERPWCGERECERWNAPLRPSPAALPFELARLEERSVHEPARHAPGLPGTLLYSVNSDMFGHLNDQARYNGGWAEVMRHNNRPGYWQDRGTEEGVKEARPAVGNTVWLRGCWMRPAIGSGLWYHTGKLLAAHDPGPNTSTTGYALVERAIQESYDSVLVGTADGQRPILVSTRSACTSRNIGISTCLPAHVPIRSGWHDQNCTCNDDWMQLNCQAGVSLSSSRPIQQHIITHGN